MRQLVCGETVYDSWDGKAKPMLLEAFAHDPKTGKYIWNDLVYYVRPYFMAPFDDVNDADFPEKVWVPAGGTRTSYFRLEDDGVFMGAYLTAHQDGDAGSPLPDLLVHIYDDVRHRPITARPCHVVTIFGSARRVSHLSEPLWLDRNETLVCTYTNNDTQSQHYIAPAIHGQRIYNDRVHDKDLDEYVLKRSLRSRQILPYFAPLDSDISLIANEERDYYYTQPADSHFEIRKILYYSLDELPIEIKIFDDGEQQLTYDWMRLDCGSGVADSPFLMYGPLVVRADTKWRFRLRRITGGNTQTGWLTLAGRQLILG